MKGQGGALDIFLFIVLVMISGILLLYVSSIFLNSLEEQMNILRIKLMEKQIFLSIISLKKDDPTDSDYHGFSYIYLTKMCNGSGYYKSLSLKDFFENYATISSNGKIVNLWDEINRTVYQGKLIVEICGYYYPCDGIECIRNSPEMKNKIKNLINSSDTVVVYRVSAFRYNEPDGYDVHIYYFD